MSISMTAIPKYIPPVQLLNCSTTCRKKDTHKMNKYSLPNPKFELMQ